MKGTIKRLIPNKGFGFVKGEDGVDRFMHARDMAVPGSFETLREGQPVTFNIQNVQNGKGNEERAVNVAVEA